MSKWTMSIKVEGRSDQIQHPIWRQDAQPLALPFT